MKTLSIITLSIIMVMVVSLLFSDLASGMTYYVDAEGGSDHNSGTSPDQAWQTLAKVSSFAFSPGDSILLRRDREWRETLHVSSSGESDRPITYGAYGELGAPPIINGADLYTNNDWEPEGGNVWGKPSHIDFHSQELIASGRAANKFIVTIDGTRLLPVANAGELREHTYTYDRYRERLLVYLTDDPDDHLTESATRSHSIRIEGKDHIVLRDLDVMNSVYDNIYIILGSKHLLLDRMSIHHAGTRGIQLIGAELDDDPDGWVDYVTIQRSTIYNIGIRCDTAANDIGMGRNVRRVTIRDCQLYGDGENWGVDGILTGEAAHGAGHLIENNVFSGHCENEIDFKGHWESPAGEGKTIIRNNFLYGSGGSIVGIHFGSRDVDILYNHICCGASHGVSLYNHDGSSVYDGQEGNVTIAYNIIRDNNLSGIKDGGSGHSVTAGGNRVYNNIIIWNGKGGDDPKPGVQFESSHWDIRNNIIWDNGDGSLDDQLWLNASQAEVGLVMSHNLVARNPMFVDAEQGYFDLRADSPAIDAGVPLGYQRDLKGRPVPGGTAPDIGAFEYHVNDCSSPQ